MKHFIFDGQKSTSLEDYPDSAWDSLSPGGTITHNNREDTEAAGKLFNTVAWLFRCVEIRANSLARVPWAIMRGNTEVWTSKDAQIPVNLSYLADLKSLLWKSEAALCLAPEAFWFKEQNRARILSLRWLAPTSVKPVWDSDRGLIGFDRNIGFGQQRRFGPGDMVYIPRPNPLHETEPGRPAAQVAIPASGVLYNVDQFAAAFFDRGAIKATVLSVEGNPPPGEVERLERWWNLFFSGIKKAWQMAAVRAGVTPVVVGEGISELANTELTKEKKEDIATALGVPHSMVFSNAANYATSQQDVLNFFDTTIIPEIDLLFGAINPGLLEAYGLRIQHRADEMQIYQQDENERSQAFSLYVNSGMKPSIAAQILGLDLPAGMEYEDLDPEEPAPEEEQPAQTGTEEPGQPNPALDAEMARFKRWAQKRKSPDPARFESDLLSIDQKAALLAEVIKATVQLDPDDDEAEQAARSSTETWSVRIIWEGLKKQYASVFIPELETYGEVRQVVDALLNALNALNDLEGSQKLRDAVRRVLVRAADEGVSLAVEQMENIGFGLDWPTANTAARDWANRYVGELIGGINETTRQAVRQAVAEWADNGEPLSALVEELAPMFGKKRAELIASTEVTRAYAEGARISYQQAGVVAEIEWRTAMDERTCPICGPLAGQRTTLDGTFEGGIFPPAHPRCRCWIVPYVAD